ncbi:MAG: serine/threonine-protein kinase [Candidatus Melainabacteria bacterium]|nr:serine/threonine-protein kinase [Candidatus Melainabacteria bacterium]
MPGKKPIQPNANCPKCGRKSSEGSSGSITQWLIVCNCNWVENTGAASDVSFCDTCSKRVSEGRAGSLTQWIFRSDLCRCAKPVITPTQPAGFVEPVEEPPGAQTNLPFEERYEKIRELGYGGAGRVALYFDSLLKKEVAVKRSIEQTARLAMDFQNEARSVSRLKHPNIVDILDFGADDGRPYIVMSFIEGVSLNQYIQEHGPLPGDVVVSLSIKLLDALSHSHRAGIFHRDIKSSNVILKGEADSFDVVLIDFGIASMSSGSLHETGGIAGTPAYMPPEQFNGTKYDGRSEIYSLGCLLFEALTGRVPFLAETALQTISLHANADVPSLREAGCEQTVDFRLEEIVMKALEKDPDDRFQSVSVMQDALSLMVSADGQSQKSDFETNEQTTKASTPPYAIPLAAIATITLIPAAICIWIGTLFHEKPQQTVKPEREASIASLLADDALEPRFEKSIGRSQADVTLGITEKISKLASAIEDNNATAAADAEKKLQATRLQISDNDESTKAAIMIALANYRLYTKQYPEAAKLCEQVIAIHKKTPPPAVKLFEALAVTGSVYRNQKELFKAQKYLNRAVNMVGKLPMQGSLQVTVIEDGVKNAIDTNDAKSADLAIAAMNYLIKREVASEDAAFLWLGDFATYARQHNTPDIEAKLLSRTTELIPSKYTETERFKLFCNLALARMNSKDLQSALKAATKAEKHVDNDAGKMGAVAGIYNQLAYRLMVVHLFDQSEKVHKRALRLCQTGPGMDSGPAISTLIQLADLYAEKGDSKKLEQYLRLANTRYLTNHTTDVAKRKVLEDLKGAIDGRCNQRSIKLKS